MTTQQQRTTSLGGDTNIPVTLGKQGLGQDELKQPEPMQQQKQQQVAGQGLGVLGGNVGLGGQGGAELQREAPRPHGEKMAWREVPITNVPQGQQANAQQQMGLGQQQGQLGMQQGQQLKQKPVIEDESSGFKQQQQQQQQQQQPLQQQPLQQQQKRGMAEQKEVKPMQQQQFASGVNEAGDVPLLREGHGDPPVQERGTFVQERVVARGLAEHNEPAVTQATPEREIDYIDPNESESYKARLAMEGGHQRQV